MPIETYQTYVDRIASMFERQDNTEAIKTININLTRSFTGIIEKLTPTRIMNDLERTGQIAPNLLDSSPTTSHSFTDNTPVESFTAIHAEYIKRLRIVDVQIQNAYSAIHGLTQNSSRFETLDIDIRDEFETLNNIAPFTVINNSPMWKLPEFTLSHRSVQEIKFDGLYLCFRFGSQAVASGVRIHADKDMATYEQRDHIYYHPHVNRDGQICMGEGEAGLRRLWDQKKISAIATMLISLLSTYNERSPFKTLDTFKQIKRYDCENCGESITENEVKFVNDDQNLPACQSCVISKNQNIVWKSDYVHSNYHNTWIAKSNATKVLGANGEWDDVENVLSRQEFRSCPKCFNMIHLMQTVGTSDGIICKPCEQKIYGGNH